MTSSPFTAAVRLAVLIPIVAGVVLFAHWPALSARALLFDDQQYVIENHLVQDPGWKSAARFLTEVLTPSTVQGYYQPLTMISLMLDWASGGRTDNLRPFHRTSLTLHVVNTTLIILVLYSIFGEPWVAAMCGLLFGVHPLTVETVAWIGERKTLLAAMFSLVCLIFYLRHAKKTDWKAYAVCLITYTLALMSKPTSTPLPLLMLLLDFWPLRRLGKRAVFEKIPFFAIGGAAALITTISQGRTAAVHMPSEYSWERIPLILCHNIIFYLQKMVWPTGLSQHYPFPEPFSISAPAVMAGVLGTVILAIILACSLRRTRALLTGWLFFFVAILPTMGVIGFTMVIAADKYVYLPSLGLLLILACFLARVWQRAPRPFRLRPWRAGVVVGVLILAVAEAVASRHQLVHWRDTEALYRRMLAIAPNSAVVHCDLGAALYDRGQSDEAIAHYEQAIEISPHYAEAYYNRAFARSERGLYDLAIKDFSRAIELRPRDAIALNNRGNAYLMQEDYDSAIADYSMAVQIRPEYAEAYNNRGFAYGRKAEFGKAIADLTRAIQLKPDYAQAYHNRAAAHFSVRQYEQTWWDVRACRRLGVEPSAALVQALKENTQIAE